MEIGTATDSKWHLTNSLNHGSSNTSSALSDQIAASSGAAAVDADIAVNVPTEIDVYA